MSKKKINIRVYKIVILAFCFIKFNWTAFIIDGVFKDIKNVTINESEPIVIDDIKYVKFVSKLIKDYQESKDKKE